MADSNLSTSIAAVLSRGQSLISSATASELADITEALKKIKKTDDATAETAVNARVSSLYSTATIDEKLKLSRAVANMLETKFVDGIQFPDDTGLSDRILKTNGMSTQWAKVSLSDMGALSGTPQAGDILVYDDSSSAFVSTPADAAKIRYYADTSSLPTDGEKGEIVLCGSDFKFYCVENVTRGVSAASGVYIMGGENNIPLTFYRGSTYTFTLDGTSTIGHPFYFTTDDGTYYSAGSYFGEYTNGVTNSRAQSGNVSITVPMDAPDYLYYQCGNHSAMRGTISVYSPWLAVSAAN